MPETGTNYRLLRIEDSYLQSRYLGKEYTKEDVEDKFDIYSKLRVLIGKYEGN